MRIIIKTQRIDIFCDSTEFHIKVSILKRHFKINVVKEMIGLNALFG